MSGRPARQRAHALTALLRPAWLLLLALLVLVAFFVAADIARRRSDTAFFAQKWRWKINLDLSYAEIAGYIQVSVAATMLAVLSRLRRPAPAYVAWSITLFVIALDDMLRIHERGGRMFDSMLSVPSGLGLRAVDVAELLTWGLMGAVLLILLVVAHRRSEPPVRSQSVRLGGLVVLLACFSVFGDMVHLAAVEAMSSHRIPYAIGLMEGAGELATMGAILAYVVHLASTPQASEEPAPALSN